MSVAGGFESGDGNRAHNFGLLLPLPAPAGPEGARPARERAAPPVIDLEAFSEDVERKAPAASPRVRDRSRLVGAASLAAILAVGAAAAAAHVVEWRATRAEAYETRLIARHADAMTARLDALDAKIAHDASARDDAAGLKKTIADVKAGAASAVAQLGQRVERIEKDPRADRGGDRDLTSRFAEIAGRLDKLEARTAGVATHEASPPLAGLAQRLDRMEKDEAARWEKLAERPSADPAKAEILARLDKLEAKAAEAKAVATTPPPAHITMVGRPEAPGVSSETTGAIERPRVRLRGFYVAEIHNGFAMIDSPSGEFEVGPGDFVPGGGRVLRIERQGRAWVVVTTQGQIEAMND